MVPTTTNDSKHGRRLFACLPARYTVVSAALEGGSPIVYPCVTRSISLSRVLVESEDLPEVDAHIHLTIARLGAWSARVSERLPHGFAATLEIRSTESDKLARRLDWLKRHYSHEASNRRAHQRLIVPPFSVSVRLASGEGVSATLLDISASGAGIQTEMRPALHSALLVSGIPGKVARYFDGGLGVRFDTEYTVAELKEWLQSRKNPRV